MFEIKVLEFGYSLKSERHFIKFLIKGINKENTEKLVEIIGQIPEGNFKRFKTEVTEEGLFVNELFPEELSS